MEQTCPRCVRRLPFAARFCARCGLAMVDARPPIPMRPAPRGWVSLLVFLLALAGVIGLFSTMRLAGGPRMVSVATVGEAPADESVDLDTFVRGQTARPGVPTILSVSPADARPGETVVVIGGQLAGVHRLTLLSADGRPTVVPFLEGSDRQLRFTMPGHNADAGSGGPLTVLLESPAGLTLTLPMARGRQTVFVADSPRALNTESGRILLVEAGGVARAGDDCTVFVRRGGRLLSVGRNCTVYSEYGATVPLRQQGTRPTIHSTPAIGVSFIESSLTQD
jgi:hypothetical protein